MSARSPVPATLAPTDSKRPRSSPVSPATRLALRILATSRAAGEAGDERRRFESVEASVAAAGDLADISRTPST